MRARACDRRLVNAGDATALNSISLAQRISFGEQVAARRGGRSIMYQEDSQYVLLEPGQDEVFVTPEELQQKLEKTLGAWVSA